MVPSFFCLFGCCHSPRVDRSVIAARGERLAIRTEGYNLGPASRHLKIRYFPASKNGIVGEPTFLDEEREVLGLRAGAFMQRASDVTSNGADHGQPPLSKN